jgi:Tfp pilus assembly protein PilN
MKVRLNLIPQYKKDEIEQSNRFKLVLKWELEVLAMVVLFIALLLSINYILKLNLFLAENDFSFNVSDNIQIKEIQKYDEELKVINSRVGEIEKIKSGQFHWANFFNKLNGTVPENVAIVNLSTKNYSVSLSGKANTRDDLIAFKENLDKEECVSNVDLPLSALVSKDNIAFQIDFRVNPICIK